MKRATSFLMAHVSLREAFVLIVLMSLLLPVLFNKVQAQSGGGYDLTWNTLDGGGGGSSGGGYTLNGTLGQPDAGMAWSGGGYTLAGGFYQGAATEYGIYLPLIIR